MQSPEADLETALYLPIKSFLEAAGYAVKGEIGGCDLVGVTDGEPPVVVICELKMTFNLELILQAVDRAAASDEVWIAARVSKKGKGREGDRRFRDLCRRLGFGMLAVSDNDVVDIVVSPIAPMPRKNTRRRSRLVEEHRRRKGDPALGGSTRKPIMTAYRQQALACAAAIENGVQRPKDMREAAPKAPQILRDNVYGWFERIDRGIYALTELGTEALKRWPAAQL
ncbi:hypothetical protein RsS62_14150 [Rhizobium dioscoreae]|uniref:DUF2161 domain-containing phosphodiesterase n=1 Tax=Rhizobium dioscoreae TaxID=2653122 RepID=A0ABQ0Z2A2_9HYPH|nr:hypothetical protein RsS62_14150 [Rhizobium dioscoreae]GES49476.1 hypothetical protein RsS93_20900 [Rhizobium dioscoreae]GLU80917.1 hypothetical protein Rhsp01_20930 [Rhizobium sp. NBRC 114257]